MAFALQSVARMKTIEIATLSSVTGGLGTPVARNPVRVGNFIIGTGDGNPGGLSSLGGGGMLHIPSNLLGSLLTRL